MSKSGGISETGEGGKRGLSRWEGKALMRAKKGMRLVGVS